VDSRGSWASWPPIASVSPTLEADEVVLITDIDGSGTLDILRADTDGSQPWRAWSIFSERPGLLARFENGLGYTREHTYRPAAQLAAEDAAAGAPWTTTPPDAMPVLTETREDDGAGWSSTLRRRLRDGWYDPARGEFRGFAELRDETTGDGYTEAATIIRGYDLGPTGTNDRRARQVNGITQGRVGDMGVALGRAVVLVPEHLADDLERDPPRTSPVREFPAGTF